jgi:hypothetical protein
MRLVLENVEMRGGCIGDYAWPTDVIDADRKVGVLSHERSPAARHISLFGGKYQGSFKTFEGAEGFARGVEAVFNHMVEVPDMPASQAA